MALELAPSDVSRLASAHAEIVDRIRTAEHQFGRQPGSVRLLAVSKRHTPQSIAALHAAGQRAFGENQVQEAAEKMAMLEDLDLEWHFIGPIQSNKTATVAQKFAWAHSIDRAKILRRLNDQRPEELDPLQICIQVKLGTEATKSGADVRDVQELAQLAAGLPRLRLRGLMTLPPASNDMDIQRGWFRQLAGLYKEIQQAGISLDTLSMGMTNDLEAAIAEGATMVRVGTALFGPRP